MHLLRLSDKTIILSLSALAGSLPFVMMLNVNSISVALVGLNALYIWVTQKPQLNWDIYCLVPLGYFFLVLFSLGYTVDLENGIENITQRLSYLILPVSFLVFKSSLEKRHVDIVGMVFMLANLFALLMCFVYSVYEYLISDYSEPLIKGSFYFCRAIKIHPTYFSMYLVFCLLLVFFSKNSLWRGRKLLKVFLALIFVFGIYHLRSRISYLAIITILLISGFQLVYSLRGRINTKVVLGGVLFSIITFGLTISNWKGIEYYLLQRDTSEAIEVRILNWEASFHAITESIFFGYGIGDVDWVRDSYYILEGFDKGVLFNYNSHNQFLESFLMGGVLALGILSCFFLMILRRFLQTRNLLVLFFGVLTAVIMLTESILVRQNGIVFFIFFYLLINPIVHEKIS